MQQLSGFIHSLTDIYRASTVSQALSYRPRVQEHGGATMPLLSWSLLQRKQTRGQPHIWLLLML